jgi:hypothetical protein
MYFSAASSSVRRPCGAGLRELDGTALLASTATDSELERSLSRGLLIIIDIEELRRVEGCTRVGKEGAGGGTQAQEQEEAKAGDASPYLQVLSRYRRCEHVPTERLGLPSISGSERDHG